MQYSLMIIDSGAGHVTMQHDVTSGHDSENPKKSQTIKAKAKTTFLNANNLTFFYYVVE